MRFTSETISNGVLERLFTLDDIPAVLWSPADATGHRPWCCWATAEASTSGSQA
jgi:hypothetical protein